MAFGSKHIGVPFWNMQVHSLVPFFRVSILSFCIRTTVASDTICGGAACITRFMLLGEPSLFPVNAEVERSWEILDPALEHWAVETKGPDPYPAGSWGPESANAMMARTGRTWRRP